MSRLSKGKEVKVVSKRYKELYNKIGTVEKIDRLNTKPIIVNIDNSLYDFYSEEVLLVDENIDIIGILYKVSVVLKNELEVKVDNYNITKKTDKNFIIAKEWDLNSNRRIKTEDTGKIIMLDNSVSQSISYYSWVDKKEEIEETKKKLINKAKEKVNKYYIDILNKKRILEEYKY